MKTFSSTKALILSISFIAIFITGVLFYTQNTIQNQASLQQERLENPFYPSEWMDYQRTFPHKYIKQESYLEARRQASLQRKSASSRSYDFDWKFEGPTNIGGRITDLAIHPDDLNTILIGAASGGILKSTDGGESWTNTFTDASVISIGDLAIDPNNPSVVYAGTGEANASSYSFLGDGIYKSIDGGDTWTHSGLTESAYIGRIIVDYDNSENVFAAACGNLFSPGGERGIYKSKNGGEEWEQILFVNDSTSAIDLVQHPTNPDILYAAMWERLRGLNFRHSFGDGSGIWKTTDGGDNWTELTVGLPTGNDVGRIGIDIAMSNPDVLYAYYDMPFAEVRVFRTEDGGNSWTRTQDGEISGNNSSFGWYFGQVRVDPNNEDRAYILGVGMYRTDDGGNSWKQISGYYNSNIIHVDNHAMYIDQNTGRIFQGNDGGFYYSDDFGDDWKKINNIGLTQFYTIEIDHTKPERIYGGTQDNNTIRTLTGSTDDWHPILGGDGFYTLVDYNNNDNIFAEYQNGRLFKSTDGGEYFDNIAGQMSADRVNWSAPLAMDPVDPEILYFGTYRVWKTTIGGFGWEDVSGDLTQGDDGSGYHTVTTIAVSPVNTNIVLAGTDDGRVHISEDAGDSWTDISEGVPERWITRVAGDPFDENTIYTTVSGFRWEESEPHVLMSNNLGANWVDISGNLPELPVNIIVADPDHEGYLFVGTDAGVYFTENYGEEWVNIMNGLPNVAVTGMKLHNPTRKLVIGTYGISSYSLNIDDLVSVHENMDAAKNNFNFYPNPVQESITIHFSKKVTGISIFDLSGRELRNIEIGLESEIISLNLADFLPGTYLIRVESGETTSTRKFIKE